MFNTRKKSEYQKEKTHRKSNKSTSQHHHLTAQGATPSEEAVKICQGELSLPFNVFDKLANNLTNIQSFQKKIPIE